jgi:hypothetical protein
MHLELATGCGESAAAHMRDVFAESLSAPNAQRVLKDDDKWKSKILHPKRSERACLVGWMKRDKEGWNGVILVFMVFGWKASFNVSGEGQQMWDEPILEKIEDELVPRPRTARIPPARLSLTTLTPPASSRQQRRALLQTSTVAPEPKPGSSRPVRAACSRSSLGSTSAAPCRTRPPQRWGSPRWPPPLWW